jgi:hypothetical protein
VGWGQIQPLSPPNLAVVPVQPKDERAPELAALSTKFLECHPVMAVTQYWKWVAFLCEEAVELVTQDAGRHAYRTARACVGGGCQSGGASVDVDWKLGWTLALLSMALANLPLVLRVI